MLNNNNNCIHKFRSTIWSDWESVSINMEVLTYQKGKEDKILIPLADIDVIKISKIIGNSYYFIIKYNKIKKLKIHSGAIEKFGSPYQNIESFTKALNQLIINPSKTYKFEIGSNKLYYFSLVTTILMIPVIITILILSIYKGKFPTHIVVEIFTMTVLMISFLIPIIKSGKKKHNNSLEKLPYNLEIHLKK